MPIESINGINLAYEVHGRGKPLVLISGLGYPAWQWHRMVPILSQKYQVITFDNRGVGHSSKPNGPYTASMLASDTAALLEHLQVKPAAIMGHSMGGFIAQAFALEYPHLVSKLILCSTNFGGPRHIPITQEAMKVLSDISSDPVTRFKNGLVVSTAPDFSNKNPEIIQAWLEWRMANPIDPIGYQAQMGIGLALLSEAASFENKLPSIKNNVLILFGAHDKVVPTGNAELLASKISHHEIAIIPDAGHFFPIETPEEASSIVIDFLSREVLR